MTPITKTQQLKNIEKLMQNLKSNSLLLSIYFFVSSCQSTKVFDLKTFHNDVNDLHVIHVNSDRIRQKCLFLNAEAENNWRHQYFIYILNDKNEVLEIMQSTNQDKDTCDSQIHKIEKILQLESKVKTCVRDELKKKIYDPESKNRLVRFGSLGNHKITYELQTLDSICNSKTCFSNNSV